MYYKGKTEYYEQVCKEKLLEEENTIRYKCLSFLRSLLSQFLIRCHLLAANSLTKSPIRTLLFFRCFNKIRRSFHCFSQLLLQCQHVIFILSCFQGHWFVICILFKLGDKAYLNKLRILVFLSSTF